MDAEDVVLVDPELRLGVAGPDDTYDSDVHGLDVVAPEGVQVVFGPKRDTEARCSLSADGYFQLRRARDGGDRVRQPAVDKLDLFLGACDKGEVGSRPAVILRYRASRQSREKRGAPADRRRLAVGQRAEESVGGFLDERLVLLEDLRDRAL